MAAQGLIALILSLPWLPTAARPLQAVPPQPLFLLVVECSPFLLDHKGSVDRHRVLFANTGARVHRGGEGEAICSLLSCRPLLSPFHSPRPLLAVFERAYKT